MSTLSACVKVLLSMLMLHSIQKSDSYVCLVGDNIRDPSKSNVTIKCDVTEVCFTKKISTQTGFRYTMGCVKNSLCSKSGDVISKPHFDVIGKRKRLLIEDRKDLRCAKCCTGDECNRKLCQEDPRCKDRVPRDCSDPKALVNICKNTMTAAFCVKSCKICPVDGGLSDWSMWTTCSCNSGTQIRHRNCTNPKPKYGGHNCTGHTQETRICDTSSCPIDGGFSNWSVWTTCSKSCDSGTQRRQRDCTNPIPKYGGNNCTGVYQESKICNAKFCPIDGGFTQWSRWDSCSKSCDSGMQHRHRNCTNPVPQNGGNGCTGDTRESKICNMNVCSIEGGFTQWSQWNTCSKTCGSGTQMRQRYCSNPAPSSGWANCTGMYRQTQQCNTDSCPQVCKDPFPECRCRFLDDNLSICSDTDGTKEHFCCYYCKRKLGIYRCPDTECEIGEIEENHKVNSGSGTTFTCI